MRIKLKTVFSFTIFIPLLFSCSTKNISDPTNNWTAKKLYETGKSFLYNTDNTKALEYYQKLLSRYPYGKYAQQASIDTAYAYYRSKDKMSALSACDRFIKEYPQHEKLDYIYYLRGLIYFNEDLGLIGYLSSKDISSKDPESAKLSYDAFELLVKNFPNSVYKEDAILRMKFLIHSLSSYEANVGEYYLNRKMYVAAINRAKYLLKKYPNSTANERALNILYKSYDALKLEELKQDIADIILLNYPEEKIIEKKRKKYLKFW